MRSLLLLFCLAFLFCASTYIDAQPPELSNARSEGLSGPVKAVEEFAVEFSMVNGQALAGRPRAVKTLTFDRVGNALEALHYDNKGELRQKLVYTFDAAGRPSGYRSHSASPRVTGLGHVLDYVFKRDGAGRITEYSVFEADGKPQVRFTYKYDDAGRLSEERWHTHLGALGGRTVHTFEPGAAEKNADPLRREGKAGVEIGRRARLRGQGREPGAIPRNDAEVRDHIHLRRKGAAGGTGDEGVQ